MMDDNFNDRLTEFIIMRKEECQVFSSSWLVGQTAQLPEYNVGILALNITANQGYK